MWRDDDEVIGAHSALYRMRSDGSDLQQLTYPPGPDMHFDEGPVLSPDGSRLWFYNNRRVYVMKADGSELAAVTEEQVSTIPRVYWSPDSHYLAIYAYESCRKVFLHHIESSTKDDLGCLGTPVAWVEPQTLNRVHDWFHDPS
jgi:Tol biopolymer transport system component